MKTLLLPVLFTTSAAFACEGALTPSTMFTTLHALRDRLKPLAADDTAYDAANYRSTVAAGGYPLVEHCGCVATVVWERFGGQVFLGRFVTPEGQDIWHVFNRLTVGDRTYDVDLTKAQFGFDEDADELRPPPLLDVTELPASELRSNARLRTFVRRAEATRARAVPSPGT